jgi:DNA-binding MarR family transcriptional regulator
MRDAPASTSADRRAIPAELPDVLQFMRLLWAIVHGLQKASKRMTRRHGVTGPQRLVLRVVGMFPGVSAGRLAAILHVHPSTLTGVLRRLVEQGLLTRSAHAGDRRRSVLRLTARGARVNATATGTVEAAVRNALRTVADADRDATKRVLLALTAQLDAPADSPEAPSSIPRHTGRRRVTPRSSGL